jgi:hypothetical protein
VTSLILTGSAIISRLGVFNAVWELDASRISFVIIILFVFMNFYCGVLAWVAGNIQSDDVIAVDRIQNRLENVWIAVDISEKLGFFGTALGMFFAYKSLGELQEFTPQAIGKAWGLFTSAMFMAVITTVAGLTSSILLTIQSRLLENSLEKKIGK